MRITISDHETHTGPKSDKDIPFRWWVSFTVGNEAAFNFSRQLVCSFSDFASYLVAKGEFDGYEDSEADGCLFMYNTDPITGIPYGRVQSWTYDEVIREFLLTRDLEPALVEFVAIKLAEVEVIEDLVLESNAA
jgi:hypothetical protein